VESRIGDSFFILTRNILPYRRRLASVLSCVHNHSFSSLLWTQPLVFFVRYFLGREKRCLGWHLGLSLCRLWFSLGNLISLYCFNLDNTTVDPFVHLFALGLCTLARYVVQLGEYATQLLRDFELLLYLF